MTEQRSRIRLHRRSVLRGVGAFGGGMAAGKWFGALAIPKAMAQGAAAQTASAPAIVTQDGQRPQIPTG